jgi:2-hydroxychromene-2-carboxylate isomerase
MATDTDAGDLEFFFDFISPYGYFASERVLALAAQLQRRVRWRPFHMRAVMKDHLGVTQAMSDVPLKGAYVRRDVRRTAELHGFPYAPAPTAGFSSVTAARVFYLVQAHDVQQAAAYAQAVFRSHHARGISPNTWAQCASLAQAAGVPDGVVDEGVHGGLARDRFRQATEDAVAAGVWGTPTLRIDAELFWGFDRMDAVAAWVRHAERNRESR